MITFIRFIGAGWPSFVPLLVAEACGAPNHSGRAASQPEAMTPQRSLGDASPVRIDAQSSTTRATSSDPEVTAGPDSVRPTRSNDAVGSSTHEWAGHFTTIDNTPFLVGITATASWSTRKYKVEFVGDGRKLMFGSRGGDLIVIPFRLVYENNTSYCDIAIFRSGAVRPLGYPPGVGGNDFCASMRKVAEADVNSDGIPDFVFEAVVRSNRYESEYVRTGAVYLSDRKRLTYCFAPNASDAVTIAAAYTPAAAVSAIEGQVEARGAAETLACGEAQ